MSRPLGTFLKENAVLVAGIALPLMLVVLFIWKDGMEIDHMSLTVL